MKTNDDFIRALHNWVIRAKPEVKHKIFNECVEQERLTGLEATNIESGALSLGSLDTAQLFWIYKIAVLHIPRMESIENYFSDDEIYNFKEFKAKGSDDVNGISEGLIVFRDVVDLTPHQDSFKQYGFYLSVREIKYLSGEGVFKIMPEIQRSKAVSNGRRKTDYHNINRVSEIANKISGGEYFYNSISMCLIENEETDWEYINNNIVVSGGDLFIPDGKHRVFACEGVLDSNSHIDDKFHVLFTVMPVSCVRKKMLQEWEFESITTAQREYLANKGSNKIIRMMLENERLHPVMQNSIFPFVFEYDVQLSLFKYSDMVDVIEDYYSDMNIELESVQKKVSDWLVLFLNKVATIFEQDFADYLNIKRSKWNVSSVSIYGYIYLSKLLYGKGNWSTALEDILGKIDFSSGMPNGKAGVSLVKKRFLKAASYVL